MKHPIAVITADVHMTVNTLELASSVLKQLFDLAQELEVVPIIAGDLLDGKAIIRGEVMNRLISIFESYHFDESCKPMILRGNHDALSEQSSLHSLTFLRPYANVIEKDMQDPETELYFIPYQNSAEQLQQILNGIPKGSHLIMHQGIQTAFMGHYQQDKTSLPPEAFKDFRVVSGHYHRHQTIKCGKKGSFTYVGSPYTTSFAEANDGLKGISILYSDGTLEVVPTHLRKHVIIERTPVNVLLPLDGHNNDDLVWLKVTGPASELAKLKKVEVGSKLLGHANFKFDKIPLEAEEVVKVEKKQTGEEVLDSIIEASAETPEQKTFLKKLWRDIL
jgi:DNA repair exonuclease SbcCD nuclease subunit